MAIQAGQETPRSQGIGIGIGVGFGFTMANAWGLSFLRHLSAECESAQFDGTSQLMQRIGRTAQTLFHAYLPTSADAAVCTVLGVSALMVSAEQVLGVELGHSHRARATVERAFVQTYQAFVRNVCLPLLQSQGQAQTLLEGMNFEAWGRRLSQLLRQRETGGPRLEDETWAYSLFFQQHGAPHLAQIMRAADQAWIHALADHRRRCCEHRPHTRVEEHAGFAPFHFVPAMLRPLPRRSDAVFELDLGSPRAGSDLAPVGSLADTVLSRTA
jgi:hypothetical protein